MDWKCLLLLYLFYIVAHIYLYRKVMKIKREEDDFVVLMVDSEKKILESDDITEIKEIFKVLKEKGYPNHSDYFRFKNETYTKYRFLEGITIGKIRTLKKINDN